jgi:transposase-like protein
MGSVAAPGCRRSGFRLRPQQLNSSACRKRSLDLQKRAVRMVLKTIEQTGQPVGVITRIARQLGVGPELLRTWARQAEVDAGQRPGVTTAEQRRIASWNARCVAASGGAGGVDHRVGGGAHKHRDLGISDHPCRHASPPAGE